MTDPYRPAEASGTPGEPGESRPARHAGADGNLRPVLWALLAVSAATNVLTSSIGNAFAGIAFGLCAVACAAALIVHHYKHRRP